MRLSMDYLVTMIVSPRAIPSITISYSYSQYTLSSQIFLLFAQIQYYDIRRKCVRIYLVVLNALFAMLV